MFSTSKPVNKVPRIPITHHQHARYEQTHHTLNPLETEFIYIPLRSKLRSCGDKPVVILFSVR